jgi:tRNA threonylcarbamoyl adenosine modification protein YeaZ
MREVFLIIDTSSNKKIKVGLEIAGKKNLIARALDRKKAQAVLPMIDEILGKHKIELKDFTGIKVNPGPGSFTGLRVGISIANTLGFLLKIPVNGKKVGEIIEPEYG